MPNPQHEGLPPLGSRADTPHPLGVAIAPARDPSRGPPVYVGLPELGSSEVPHTQTATPPSEDPGPPAQPKRHLRVPGKPGLADAPDLVYTTIIRTDQPTPRPPAPAPQSDEAAYVEVETRTLRAQLDHWPTGHDLCGRGVIVGYSDDGATRAIIPLCCCRWDCPRCARWKRKAWTARIISGKPQRWITLTMRNDEEHPLAQQARVALDAWPKFVKIIRQEFGTFEYVRCSQVGKNGGFHFHVPYRGEYMPQQWLSKVWQSLTGSFRVHIANMPTTGKIAAYVARYVARDAALTHDTFPDHRIITMSRHYLDPYEPPTKRAYWQGWTWSWSMQGIEEILREWNARLTDRCWAATDGTCWLFEISAPPQPKPRHTPRAPPEATLFLPTAGR